MSDRIQLIERGIPGPSGPQGAQGNTGNTGATGPGAVIVGTSASTHTVGTGSKVFVTQAGMQIAIGDYVAIIRTAAPTTTWMSGQVTGYSGTSLTVNVEQSLGSGSYNAWTISKSGKYGVGLAFPGATVLAQIVEKNETPQSMSAAAKTSFIANTNVVVPTGTWTLVLDYSCMAFRETSASGNYVIMWCRYDNADQGRSADRSETQNIPITLRRCFLLTGVAAGVHTVGMMGEGFGGSGNLTMNNGIIRIDGWRTS